MKSLIVVILTAFLVTGAWVGQTTGNDFLLFLFGLLAFAPVTAVVATKTAIA